MADRECSSKFWVFVSGAIVGATMGILFAPDSGKNTRAKIKAKLKDLAQKLEQLKEQKAKMSKSGINSTGLRDEDYKQAEELLEQIENLYKSLSTH